MQTLLAKTASLIVLLLVATACGSSSDTLAVDSPPTAPTSEAREPTGSEPEAEADEASQAPEAEDEADASVPATTQVEACGFGSGSEADTLVVTQVAGEGRQANPSALADPRDASFPAPLIEIDRILSGGPPPDGIPPIDNPVFQSAETVDWLQCQEPILVLEVDGETRGYPVQIMTWHEIVNDTFGDLPVTVSFCPLCNSSLAYVRELDNVGVVTFGTSGRLYNSSLVMYDRETESLWTHFNGQAVVGELAGVSLQRLPTQTMSWGSFLQANPTAAVLTTETGHRRDYGRNPYPGYDDVSTNPFLLDGEVDSRLAAKERVVGIERNGQSAVLLLSSLAATGVLEADVGGDTLTAWHLPGTASALEAATVEGGRDIGAVGVYLPVVDGETLTFTRDADNQFVDDQTGSVWSIQGRALDGPLAGSQLTRVEHLDTFWFAFAAFAPDTQVISG